MIETKPRDHPAKECLGLADLFAINPHPSSVPRTKKPRMARRKVATAGSEGAVSGELDDSAVQRNDAMCVLPAAQTPPGMQPAPEGSSKTIVDTAPAAER
jgi:hypothetical protein